MRFKSPLLVLFALLTVSVYAQNDYEYNIRLDDPNDRSREHALDILKMVVNVSFEPEKGKVIGKVNHYFQPIRKTVDTFFWDAPGIDIKSARIDGRKLEFKTTPEGVITYFNPPLSWEKKHQVQFEYEAFPRKGIYFVGWDEPEVADKKNQTRRQVWTQGQGIDHRHWIPMYDFTNDKYITETLITFDAAYKVLSNGKLNNVRRNSDGTKTWHYAMTKPHAGYLLMLAIDKYDVKKSYTKNGTPVQFWYYPEHPEKVEPSSRYTEDIITFLEEETGYKYAWGTYSQVMVQDFMYGAMENTSATIFGDFFFVDSVGYNDRNYVGVNAHELTHQWFGDLITARSGRGTWLQESFATYYAKLYIKRYLDEDHYKWNHYHEIQRALQAAEKDDYPVGHSQGGTSRFYPKGSAVIQMMRDVLGDEAFKKVIDHYLDKHAFQNVTTHDLYLAVFDVLGVNLDWFFEQWIYKGGEPHYKVSYMEGAQNTDILVEQIHQQNLVTGLFTMPVQIRVHYENGQMEDTTVWISEANHHITVPNNMNSAVKFIIFDVNNKIIKKLSFPRSRIELMAQADIAENMMDRYLALVELRDHNWNGKFDFLKKAFAKNDFHAVKSECIQQILGLESNSIPWLSVVFDSAGIETQKVIASGINQPSALAKEIWVKSLVLPSYNLQETALDKLVEYYSENTSEWVQVIGNRGHNQNLYCKVKEYDFLYGSGDTSNVLELVEMSGPQYEFRARINAMHALQRIGYFDNNVAKNLLHAIVNTNRRLAGPAQQVLSQYASISSQKKVILQAAAAGSWTEAERTILKEKGWL